MQPPQIHQAIISLPKPFSVDIYEFESAELRYASKAVMLGLLAVRVNFYGFGPQEEEILRAMGGDINRFVESVSENTQRATVDDSLIFNVSGKAPSDAKIRNVGLNFPDPRYYDISSRFDGWTVAQVEQYRDIDEKTRNRIISYMRARHKRVAQDPLKTLIEIGVY